MCFLEDPSSSLSDEAVQEIAFDESVVEEVAEIDEDFAQECARQLPQHLRCASHTLNLIATTDTAKAIEHAVELAAVHALAMEKCNSIWKNLRSPKASEALKTYLGVALKRPVVTRWNSLFDALEQIVSVEEKLLRPRDLEAIDMAYRKPLTTADFEYLKEYLRCTKDLAKAIDLLQGEKYCHYGYLLPTLVRLRHKMQLLGVSSDIAICQPIIRATINGLEKRFKAMFEVTGEGKVAAIAAVSHPEFKIRWLGCLTEAQQKIVYDFVVSAVSENTPVTPPPNAQPASPIDEWDFGSKPTIFDSMHCAFNHATSEVEVTRYLGDDSKDFAMLLKYPNIRKVFLKYNTPLPSSAPVERLFSYATMLDLPKFNRLTDCNFEKRVLAKVNAAKYYN